MACATREVPMARWKHNFERRPVRVARARDNRSNGSGNERRPGDLRFVYTAFPGWRLPRVASTNWYRWAWHNRLRGPRKRRRFGFRNRPDTYRGAGASLFRKRSLDCAVRSVRDTIAQAHLQ